MSDNIKVAIRVRPLISRERNEKLREQWDVQNNLIYPIDFNGKKNGDSYVFDHIFHGNCSNEDIYKTVVHPVVDGAINGFNGTIFAYGQTSSGKTYTMMGDENEPGLISIAVKNIFLAIQQAVDRKFLLRVSYMEIYNEKVYDLLDIKNNVTIHENTKGIILNLKEEYTDCPEKVYMVMKHGDKARRIGETNMNDKSSRSHAIFRIIIESSDVKDDKGVVVNVAHLNLVDLAGSERAAQTKATGMRLKEGANINKSLSTLSLVMKQLSESQDFINFRDSKLTRILQSSLGGNARTAIICAVTPAALEETHSTLAFASRAKIVKNKPCLNEVLTDEAVIIRYALQIKKLKKDLEEAKDKAKYHEKLQEKIGRIEKYMIYSSKSTDKKKSNTNRRQTWCAPRNREVLPSIDEIDILRNHNNKLPSIIGSDENLDKEEFPSDLFDLEVERRNLPCTQRKLHHTFSLTRGLSLPSKIPQHESPEPETIVSEEAIDLEKTNETGIDSKDVVKWLVNETGTPKSVLRDRASYYNNELKALKELTDKEKELLYIEHKKETEKLHSKISQLEEDLNCAEEIKNQFKTEKTIIQSKNDELRKKNAELSRINFQLQKVLNLNNDAEFMLEMMQEKFKKRESELLEQLTEARLSLSNIQDDTKNTVASVSSETSQCSVVTEINVGSQFEISSQVDASTQSDIASESSDSSQFDSIEDSIHDCENIFKKLIDYKDKINAMKDELTSDYIGPDLKTTFDELNKLCEELTSELKHCPEDIQEEFSTLKYMHQNIMYLFTFEKTMRNHELESNKYVNRIAQNQRKELTYEKLVKEQGDAMKQLSKKVLEAMQQEQELQNQLDLLEKSQKIEIDELNKEYTQIINMKDKEIEDLSDKIMEYIDLITPLEEESKKYKELLQNNLKQAERTELPNNPIEEKNEMLDSCTTQINSLSEELERNRNELIASNKHNAQLKAEIEQKSQEIFILQEEEKNSNELRNTVQSLTEQLESKSQLVVQLENKIDFLQLKIDNKQQEICDLIQEKSDVQNEFTEFKNKNDELTQTKLENNNTIQSLTEQLVSKSELVAQLENKIDSLQLEINNKQQKNSDLVKEKSDIQNEFTEFKNRNKEPIQTNLENINEINEKLSELHEELNVKEDILKEIREELNNKLELLEMNNVKLTDQSELIQLKNIEIETLKQKLIADKIKIQFDEHSDKLNKMTKKSEILEEKVQLYEEQLTSKDNKILYYKNELRTKKGLIAQLSNEIELLSEKIITYESHIDALANQIEEQTKNIELKNKKILELHDAVFTNKPSIQINPEDNIKTNNLIDHDNEIKNYKQVCNDQVAELASIKERLNEYQNKYDNFHSSLNVIQDLVVSQFGEYIKVNEENKLIMQLIQDTENAIKTLKMDISKKQESSPDVIKELIISYSRKLEHFKDNENQLEANKLLLEQKQKEVTDLTNELLNINEKIRTCPINIISLNEEKESLEQQINKYEQQESEFNTLDSNIEKEDLEIKNLTAKLTEAQNELQSYESNMENLKSSVQLYKNQIDEYMEAKINFEKLLLDKEEKKELLNKEICEYNKQQIIIISNIDLLKDQIVLNTSKLESMQKELNLETENQCIEEKDQEIARLCEKLNEHEQQFKNYELDVKILNNVLTWSNNFLREIENKRSCLDTEIVSLRNNLEQQTQENVELNDKCLSLNTQIQYLIKEKDDEIKTLREYQNEEKQNYVQYKQQMTELNKKIQDLTEENENTSTQKDSEIKRLKESFNNEKQKYEEQIQEMNNIREEFKIIKAQNLDFIKKNTLLNDEIEKMQTHIQKMNSYEKELEDKLKTFEVLCVEIDTLKADCLQKEQANIEYNENIQNLTEKLQKTSLELQFFKDQYADKENETEIIKQNLESNKFEIVKINKELSKKNEELVILKNEMIETNLKKDEKELIYNKDIQEKLNEIKKLNDKIKSLEKCQLDENFKKEFNNIVKSSMNKIEQHNELIKNVKVYSEKIESCNKAVNLIRSQLELTKNALKTKEEQLNIVLAKILNHMKPKCEISANVDLEEFTQQCNVAFSNNEIKKLRHENSEYKALVAKIRQKANTQIGNFQNILVNAQSENEKLKITASTNVALIKSLEEKIRSLQNEIAQTSNKDSVFAALQTKIQVLEDDKKELKKVGNYLQEQTTQKITELKEYKKRLDFLKKENAEFLKCNTDYLHLKKKLTATEESLRAAQSTIKQLEMEKDNFNATSRSLEESLEDVKFELYALKNKERERMKKHKRRSLHDSSRVLSEIDEPIPIEDNKQKYEPKKDEETQMNSECERCKILLNENQSQDLSTEICKLRDEVKSWRRKYDICKDLCIIRKRKIEELEIDKRRGRE